MRGVTFIGIVAGIALSTSVVTSLIIINLFQKHTQNTQTRITNLYEAENAVLVSPHELRTKIDKRETDFVLVDLRSSQEYEREHIVGALSVPTYTDPNTPTSQTEKLLSQFRDISFKNQGKDIVLYGYTASSEESRSTGLLLAQHNIYTKELTIGWNEWRYFWTLWNHEHEWGKTHAEDYVVAGTEPGKFTASTTPQ